MACEKRWAMTLDAACPNPSTYSMIHAGTGSPAAATDNH